MAEQCHSLKMRARKRDPLHQVMKALERGELERLKLYLNQSPVALERFKERLLAPRVPKDHSPLVSVILKGKEEVFDYLLKYFQVNLEQETSAIIEGGYPVEGATPLWTASTLGRIDFVRQLVSRGADIEHTTDSKSSPLRGAAFDGHCDVCEFLIGKGADIDKPNQVGQSPLTIAAAMQKKECVQLLINKGADVNHKGHNGDTPLHVSVESGALEIAKILVLAGALNSPNDVGFTPAILACCYGHKEVMNYLHTTFVLDQKELYDCYCLLAAKEVLAGNLPQAGNYIRQSLEVKQKNPETFTLLPRAHPVYNNLQEPNTETELQHILADETRMFFLSSIYCERILGRVHPTTAFYIRISGDMVLADDGYSKCIDLWHRSLDFDNAARMAYELQITEDLLFAVRGFSIMVDDGFIPPVEPHFQWGLKEFGLAQESKISEVAVVSCLFRMIAVWIKVAEASSQREREEERLKILRAVDSLIVAMEGNSCPLLVACLQNLPEHSSGAGKDVVNINIPLHKAVALILDRGASVHCEDEDGNFPLHLTAKLADKQAPLCVKTLLDYGAHHDAVNFNKETALDVAKLQSPPLSVTAAVVEELQRANISNMSLQCLATRVVVKTAVPYLNILPKRIIQFVSWHEGDTSTSSVPSVDDVYEVSESWKNKSKVIGLGLESSGMVGSSCLVVGTNSSASNGYMLQYPHTLNGLNTNPK